MGRVWQLFSTPKNHAILVVVSADSRGTQVKRFEGTDWEECHGFIVAIRARALWEGKQRDSAWIADFASPLFWRKALIWHGQLPLDVRQDWIKLEAALFNQWPLPVDDDM
ncbi:hypothetical protein FRC00_006910 [Tulasnella sp. 408]|nr:hypothetical protein FRC00_006910 [Tulasnella sp. 408]